MDKTCPACSSRMDLKIKGYAMGSPLARRRFHVDIYSCPKCSFVELYAAKDDSLMVTCPVCGTRHSANERCVTCALNGTHDA